MDDFQSFAIECDASDVAVSATVIQDSQPVAFMSRSLTGN